MDAAAEIRRNPKLLEQESRRDQERGDPTKASTHAFLDDKAEHFAAGNAGGWNMKQLIYVIQSTVQGRIIRRLAAILYGAYR